MRKQFYYPLLYLFTLLVFSCGDDDSNPPSTLPNTGNINGEVILYDEGTTQLDNSGMKISDSDSGINDETDATGSFTLVDVPFGGRTLSYEKTGYGTYKYFIQDHNSELNLSTIPSLGKISQTRVITNAVAVEGDVVKISTVTSGTNTEKRYIRYFFSTESDVNSNNYEAVSESAFESDPNTNPIVHELSKQALIDYGFPSGTTVYAKVYGDSFWNNSYEDPDLQQIVFPNLNENSSESVMFMVP